MRDGDRSITEGGCARSHGRRALGIRKWGSAPHNVVYWSIQRAAWYCGGDNPFFEADLTKNEVDAIMVALREDLGERGWDLGGEDFER